jgi:hypothetical protein
MNVLLEEPVYEDPSDLPDEELELAEQTVISTESALVTLTDISHRLASIGRIDRDTANTIRTLTTGMESMDVHFSRHPVNSYTAVPGQTNLKVTQEGVLGTIAGAVWSAIKAVWNFITGLFKSIFGVAERNEAKFVQVEATVSKVLKAHPEPRTPGTKEAPQRGEPQSAEKDFTTDLNAKQQMALASLNLNPFAKFLCSLKQDAPEGFPIKCHAVHVPKLLAQLETAVLAALNSRLDGIIYSAVKYRETPVIEVFDRMPEHNYTEIFALLKSLFILDHAAEAACDKEVNNGNINVGANILFKSALASLDVKYTSRELKTYVEGMFMAKLFMIERKADLFYNMGATQTLTKVLRKHAIERVAKANTLVNGLKSIIPTDDNVVAEKLRKVSVEISNLSSIQGIVMSFNSRYHLACSTASAAALAFWL